MRGMWMAAVLVAVTLAGCASDSGDEPVQEAAPDVPPYLDYAPVDPDAGMVLDMFDIFPEGSTGNILHGRVVMPEGDGPFPTIVQHTPYTAPGCNTSPRGMFVEPPVVTCGEGTFENQFAKRGYVYIHADLRGTGDSDDCLNLRGQADIDDIGALADAIAEQPWSNGNVGFIGASYPGSTSHMAAMSGSEAVKAVVPIVASTSFYHYHHNDGVPYNGQHSLGGTNAGYTTQGLTPTANPASGLAKLVDQPLCPHVENAVMHGGMDQSGAYYDWWQERNLRPGAKDITVPVLMAQGLADWNVKPDHIEHWFNDLNSSSKTFIGGQWGHAYPASDDGACPDGYEGDGCLAPWGDWWAYAAAFFDTYLKEIDTGMFEGSTAWVQDNNGTWHRSTDFPLLPEDRGELKLYLDDQGGMSTAEHTGDATLSWYGCPHDRQNMGQFALAAVEEQAVDCGDRDDQSLVFVSEAFTNDTLLSGVPELHLNIDTDGRDPHITVVMDVVDGDGDLVRSRENYGYLNTVFRHGLEDPQPMGDDVEHVVVDMYPQEDLIEAGQRLRITVGSDDGGRTIESYDEGLVDLVLGGEKPTYLKLFTRPEALQGTRLA